MKNLSKLALSTCVVAGALIAAGSAAAVPRLTVGAPDRFALGGNTVEIHFTEENTDAAPAKITMYAPEGFTGNVGAAIGQQLGTVHAAMQTLATSAQSTVSTSGTLTAEDPAKYLTNTCSPGGHTAVWLAHLTVSGQAMNVPIFVDSPVPESDAFSGNSQIRLLLCLASPYAQAGAARAPSGAKLTSLRITLNTGILVNPSARGVYAWRSIVTPYTVNSATANTSSRVEARAMVFMPKRLGLNAKVVTKRRYVRIHGRRHVRVTNWALLRGQVLEGLQGVPNARVVLLSGPRAPRLVRRGAVTTNAGGLFSLRLRLRSKSTFQASLVMPERDVTSRYCVTGTPGIRCASATAPAFAIVSDVATLKPRRH